MAKVIIGNDLEMFGETEHIFLYLTKKVNESSEDLDKKQILQEIDNLKSSIFEIEKQTKIKFDLSIRFDEESI